MRILITGGTSGLGFAMAEALLLDGHRVAVTGRDAERSADAAARLAGGTLGIAMDVRDTASIDQGRERVLDSLGGLDILINNAGIGMRTVNPDFFTRSQPFWQVSANGFRDVIDTNLTGYFLVTRAFVPDLLAAPDGRLINVSMNHSTMTRAGLVPYGPSRAGAEALSRIMGGDLIDLGVTVNLLLPGGPTATGMLPDNMAGVAGLMSPDIMAAPVRWLCSPAAAGVHDQRVVANEFDDRRSGGAASSDG